MTDTEKSADVSGVALTDLLGGEGSDLYQRQIADCDDELMHTVWDGTPWMVDHYVGGFYTDGRREEIMHWCTEEFGPEAWPIHGKAGNWHSGGAIIFGWQWMGFATEEMMQRFVERWPPPNVEIEGRSE